jgi:hypothetical protein
VSDPLAAIPQCPAAAGCPSGLSGVQPDVNLDTATCSNPSPCPAGTFVNGVLQPGVYNDVTVSNTGTLAPGIYVLTGQFHASNSHALTMSGVTLYMGCITYPLPCLTLPGGWIDWTGGGPVTLSAPTSGPYAGLSVFYDRLNTVQTSVITSGGSSTISGTVYMLDGKLTLTGGGGTVGSALIVGTIKYTGGGPITVDPTAGLNVSTSRTLALYQ